MTPTIRADMTDQKTQMREGFEAQRKAGMNVDWFTWQIAWHDALFTVHDLVGDATGRQPAAIDKQEPVPSMSHANEAAVAKEYDLDESTVRDLWNEFVGMLAAPSVAQDERGAFEEAARICEAEAKQHKPSWEDYSHQACLDCAEAIRARAASTSANVAQGAEAVGWFMQRSKFGPWVEVEQQEPGAEQFYRGAPPAQTALTGRVLTYRNQPDNVGAWQLGDACRRAAELPAGDYIDRGLGLLKELQAKGYGVIALIAAQSASGESRADKA